MNAIILAAGLGGRMGDIVTDKPKPLITVNEMPIIERQVNCLHEIGVNEIHIVTGYLAESFSYLEHKYNVNLIFNPEFATCNNIYSLYVSRNYFGDSYVFEADVFINRNFLKNKITASTYFTGFKENIRNEWILEFDDEKKLERFVVLSPENLPVQYSSGAFITSGISYWTKQTAAVIKTALDEKIVQLQMPGDPFGTRRYFWDQLVLENLSKLDIKVETLNSDDWFEIDCLSDLEIARAAYL
jgi:CTP:phosphocholine cytidylyltransferase-like protein